MQIPTFKPKPGIFNDRQLSEILYSLDRKGRIPRKYGYFGTGVKNWTYLSIASFFESKNQIEFYSDEQKLVKSSIQMALGGIPNNVTVNVIDIGSGTGHSALSILLFLEENEKIIGKYVAVDIVEDMAKLAISTIKENMAGIKTDYYVYDFEDGHFADYLIQGKQEKEVNLFLFFGSTLPDMVNRHRALANIKDSMCSNDLLWIGTKLHKDLQKSIDYYNGLELNSEEYMFQNKHFMSFFESFDIPWQDYGYIREEGDSDNCKTHFIVSKPFALEIKVRNSKNIVEYLAGDKIIMHMFRQYPESDLILEIREAGMKVRMLNISDDYRVALVLAGV